MASNYFTDRVVSKMDAESDPYWAVAAAPVFAFLDKPRSWANLKEFAKAKYMSGDMLANIVGWLQNRGQVNCFGEGRDVLWLQTRLLGTAVMREVPPREPAKASGDHQGGEGAKRKRPSGKNADDRRPHHGRRDGDHAHTKKNPSRLAHSAPPTEAGATE